jgi:hypothetical protein
MEVMPPKCRSLLAALVSLAYGAAFHTAAPRAQTRNPLAGTWSLVSTIVTLPDGTTRPDSQVGPTPKGYMIYGDANRMCAQFTNPARPPWRSTTQPTIEELRSLIDFMGAYCARYEVNVAESYVLHHVEIDRVPNFSNQVRRRNFRFDGRAAARGDGGAHHHVATSRGLTATSRSAPRSRGHGLLRHVCT